MGRIPPPHCRSIRRRQPRRPARSGRRQATSACRERVSLDAPESQVECRIEHWRPNWLSKGDIYLSLLMENPMAKIVDWDARIGGRVRLRDLHILLAVVQRRRMAHAAEQLGASPPAVSEAGARLEHALD